VIVYFFAVLADLAGGKPLALFLIPGGLAIVLAGRSVKRDLDRRMTDGSSLIEWLLLLALGGVVVAVMVREGCVSEKGRLMWSCVVYGVYMAAKIVITVCEQGFNASVSEFILGKVVAMIFTTGHFSGGEKGYAYDQPGNIGLDLGAEEDASDHTGEGFS
jgi:hypothetical protein